MERKQKYGLGMGEILPAIVLVSAVLILIVLMVFVFGSLGTSFETTADSHTVVNQSGAINQTGFQLANGIGGTPRDFSVILAINASSNKTIQAANYTTSSTGLVTNATAIIWSNVKFTYVYSNDSSEISAAYEAQNSLNNALPLVGVLFIIIAVGAVITILVFSLLRRRS